MHRLSRIFQPISMIPKCTEEITSKSQRLMLDLGIIKQGSPGSFNFLPLGVRALQKLIRLVDREMYRIGAQKVIFPTLTNANLWKTSGRFNNASELFTLNDRHKHTYILSPTHEEVASEILGSLAPLSYKEFPLRLYQTTSKFRDEMKPRFGLMRARQFTMKDLYTFDVDRESAQRTYDEVCESYDRIFKMVGVNFDRVLGDSGMMGGALSHEYHYRAPIGEDNFVICPTCHFSANVEVCNETKNCPSCGNLITAVCTGIEVGHTFFLGDKYTKAFRTKFISSNGKTAILQMGSYGLGLTRILAAGIEVLSKEQEMRWPTVLAPFKIIIIPPKEGSKEEAPTLEYPARLYGLLNSQLWLEDDILLDDRTHLTIGRRILDARRVGYPYIVIIGAKATNQHHPLFELHNLQEDTKDFLSESDLLNYFRNKFEKHYFLSVTIEMVLLEVRSIACDCDIDRSRVDMSPIEALCMVCSHILHCVLRALIVWVVS